MRSCSSCGGNPEEAHLDSKARVDLNQLVDKLKFVKDAVAISNRPPGGYILIGVDDAGTPCMPIGTIANRRSFDGARLGDLVPKYIEGEIHLTVQIHDHEGQEIVVVWVPHHRDGLPVPFSKDGQYYEDSDGKSAPCVVIGERPRSSSKPNVSSEACDEIHVSASESGESTL